MGYKFPKYKMNNGLFGPTSENNYYKPIYYHNKNAVNNSNKSKWILKDGEQYEVFRLSDEGKWKCDENDGLFSILMNGNEILGQNEERIAFFRTPQNISDPWHGFPIYSSDFEPSAKLIDKWFDDKIIDERMRIKILKGDI